MIDHISLRVRDYPAALAFYKQALAPLGYQLLMEFPGVAGLGANGKADLWLTASEGTINPVHVAFATDRKTVDAFHAAGLAAGGRDNGAPGPRAEYHPNYYGAFILDPEGNNIEAVCHAPAGAAKKPRRAAARKKPAASKAKPRGRKKAKR